MSVAREECPRTSPRLLVRFIPLLYPYTILLLTIPDSCMTGRWRRPMVRNRLKTCGRGASLDMVYGLGFMKTDRSWGGKGGEERREGR